MKVPVLDFHTDTVTDHVICAEPRSYSLTEGQQHGERRIEVIHIAGQRGAVAVALVDGLAFRHGGRVDAAGIVVNLYGILFAQNGF